MHKKGEDVLNNFVKSLNNAVQALTAEVKQADSRFDLSQDCKQAYRWLQAIRNDARLNEQTRTQLRAPATGVDDDANSQRYGAASREFQTQVRAIGVGVKNALRALKQHKSESEFNRGFNDAAAAKNRAIRAWSQMVASGFDEGAAQALLQGDAPHRVREQAKLIAEVQAALQHLGVRGAQLLDGLVVELNAHVPVALLRA